MAVRASGWGSQSGETVAAHCCEAEVEFGKRGGEREGEEGGVAQSASETEGIRRTDTMSASLSLCVGGDESRGREAEFKSVGKGGGTVALTAGRLISSSSGSPNSCSDIGQNGSRTCRNTRAVTR